MFQLVFRWGAPASFPISCRVFLFLSFVAMDIKRHVSEHVGRQVVRLQHHHHFIRTFFGVGQNFLLVIINSCCCCCCVLVNPLWILFLFLWRFYYPSPQSRAGGGVKGPSIEKHKILTNWQLFNKCLWLQVSSKESFALASKSFVALESYENVKLWRLWVPLPWPFAMNLPKKTNLAKLRKSWQVISYKYSQESNQMFQTIATRIVSKENVVSEYQKFL